MTAGRPRSTAIRTEPLTGTRLADALGDVARLRIAVFRDWPYLYDGSLAYEHGYLAEFATAPDAVIIAAYDGEQIVGAATAAPLAGHSAHFASVLAAGGLEPAQVFYFGESVLLRAYRGQGIGHAFFDLREAHARACCGASGPYLHAAFCAVVRDANDPRRPLDYRALDDFWRNRGFAPVSGMIGSYDWREVDAAGETPHPMQFWVKCLSG